MSVLEAATIRVAPSATTDTADHALTPLPRMRSTTKTATTAVQTPGPVPSADRPVNSAMPSNEPAMSVA